MTCDLQFLDFECSESDTGAGTFDALATCSSAQLPALLAELAIVLTWAHQEFPGQRGDVDEAGEWDYALSSQREWTAAEGIDFDPLTERVQMQMQVQVQMQMQMQVQAQASVSTRHTVSLALSGRPAFCDAFRIRFGL